MPVTINPTNIVFNDGTTQSTAAAGGGGTVTSVATGNGLQGGTITTSGTLSVACPAFNTVGSYAFVFSSSNGLSSGGNYAAGQNVNQIQSGAIAQQMEPRSQNNLSGTWKWMGSSVGESCLAVGCRVS